MSHPDDERLAELALADDGDDGADGADGDDERREPDGILAQTRAHVAACADCASVVAELRHALLGLVHDPGLTQYRESGHGEGSTDRWLSPCPQVWERISAEIDAADRTGETGETGETAETAETQAAHGDGTSERPRPVEVAHPDERAAASDTGVVPERRRARPRPWGWAAGLAAAGLVVGLLTGRALWSEPSPPPATVATVAQTGLDTLDTQSPTRLGEATVVSSADGYALDVATTATLDAGDGYLEVWLINRDGKRMVSVGLLRGSGPASFPINRTLIDQGYVVVDISREQFDDQPAHSGQSLARGRLPV